MGRGYYSSGQLAKLCKVTKHTILTAIQKGEILSTKTPGGHHRIMEPAAFAFMKKCRVHSDVITGVAAKMVLLFGEDPETRSAAAELLRRLNLSIMDSGNLFEAGMLFERLKPRMVVFTATNASARENLEGLLRQLHAKSRLEKTKILVLGADCSPEERAKLHLAGIHGFLSLAISPEDLGKRVGELLYDPAAPVKKPSTGAGEAGQALTPSSNT
jgi:excisionase family DNA binding protein